MRFFDWIWHIRGTLALAPGMSGKEAFDRLDPLFDAQGTSYERNAETLTFTKKDQAAQDRMSIFDGGIMWVETGETQPVLRYALKSRALLACFLAPLVFLAFAQFAVAVNMLHDGGSNADRSSERSADVAEEEDEEQVVELHPIDKFLGAPEPKQPDDEEEDASDASGREGTEEEAEEEEDRKHSPTPAYVFAGIFAVIYLVGRLLEDRLIKRRFRRLLEEEPVAATAD
ncbi:MAG: hypothetical protein AAF292_15235 [Pseudomonadota bacterium]